MTQKKQNSDVKLALALEKSKLNVKRQMILAVVAILATAVLMVSMTVAWYSNILHTSDLVFQAKSWDFKFEGNINLGASGGVIEAAPGQTGIVHLTVANVSGKAEGYGEATEVTPIGVNVNISKEKMSSDMQRRMYFYVDKSEKINGETVTRQYLSNESGYMYTIYPGNRLELNEDYYNDYRMYWYWVNDVVGYYFTGVVTDSTVTVEEYIRPVEYDYDHATFDASGNLAMVSGVNATEFIESVLSSDGYDGNKISTKVVDGKTYYKVSVEGNYGVWMYLCSEAEILRNMQTDTDMATNGVSTEFKAQFVLTGQQVNLNAVEVGSLNDLKDALKGSNELIKLSGDMEINTSLPVSGDKVLDLNGHTLTVDMGSGYSLTTTKGSLSVINGTVVSSSEKTSFIKAVQSEVYVDNVIVEGFYEGVVALDNEVTEDSHVFITNSTLNTADTAVWVKGNGSVSATPTTIVIENSILNSSEYIAITGSGNDDMAGVDLQIMNSTVTGHYAAVYHPMPNSSMYAYDTNFEGMVGIAVKAGKVHLVDCRVHGNDANPEEAKYEGSGFTQTGDAVYVEDSYVVQHGYELSLIVDGSKTSFTSSKGKALRMFKDDSTVAKIVVLGGKFSSDVSAFLPKDSSRVCVNESGMFVVKISE